MKKNKTKYEQPSVFKKGFDSEYAFSLKKMGHFMKIIIETAKDNILLFATLIIVTILDAIVIVLLPLVSNQMVKTITEPEIMTYLFGLQMTWETWLYTLVGMLFAIFVLEWFTNFTTGMFSAKIEVMQRNKILISLVNQDVDFFFDNVSGNIFTRLVADTQGLSMGIQQFLLNIIWCGSAVVSSIVVMFANHQFLIGGILLAYLVVVILIAMIIFVFFRRTLILAYDMKREIDADMTDRINNISLIKASGLEEYEINRLFEKNDKYAHSIDRTIKWNSTLNLWINITTSFFSTLVIIISAIMYANNKPAVYQDLPLILLIVAQAVVAIIILVPTLRAATMASNASNRIAQLTEPVPFIVKSENPKTIEGIDSVEFRDISFAYPKKIDKVILPNLNITFEKGKSYAFVGETGSGKSTIARLLLRFYDPIKGQVIINDKFDLIDLDLPNYLSNVGYVEQEPQIFFGDFIENIKYVKFDATDEEVIEACKKAKLHDFILTLPEGYQTILGQRGFLLSGGQKQRLVIARVFLKNPDLIILDEATSALDNIVEKEIQAQLDELIRGKTSITIAHRLSTIKNVDEIIVLGGNGGGIVQRGSFEELKSTPGHFKKLYEAGLMK
ncbi:ABC transporter ATP-binding protein [Mesoplasma photuris]|uniref:ABC transporter ATP-binding protein n=1 Tax=Mesoplasma photuris TaxID=217731 RepID=UPI0004E249A5|nr:ABC transporter ATP-binding protein/permease [Mesoplasma photuris]